MDEKVDTKSRAPMLNADNRPVWSEEMALLLKLNRCFSAVASAATSAATPASSSSGEGSEAQSTQQAQVDAKTDEQALALIGLHCGDEYITEISESTSASSLWKRLETKYLRGLKARKLTLRREFMLLRMHDSENFQQFYDRGYDLYRKLKAVKVALNEDDLCTVILAGVRSSYRSSAESLYSPDIELAPTVVLAHMLAAEDRLGMSSDRSQKEVHAYLAKVDSKTCWNCGKRGHVAAKCTRLRVICANCSRRGHLAEFCKAQPEAQATLACGEVCL